jgi:uncharacterized protein YuzE
MEPILEPQTVQTVTEAVPLLLRFPMRRFWVDYDREADVLYISFRRPQQATDTKMTKEGILLRSCGKELVGITVLDASTRAQASQTPPQTSKAPKRPRKKKL